MIFDANIKNVFIISQVTHSGTPDIITLQGESANISGDIINKIREQSYYDLTLGDIIATIATRSNLTYRYDKLLGSKYISHIDQTKESDSSFLTRLVNDYGGGVTVKNDILIAFNKGQGITVNGKKIPPS
ncbi:contractile injection system protein, VgrG/Pvc8 family [Gilliamella apicola]|uniref:contractile injection system protein, VgrG/Pvc8 family n=1 Tax=Gilliamella apicola TaxID=1196095 RepID=UPI00164286EE|nr:contractile injection system protein, VgrG/Pvc8 family [Gilliamella apicola]